MQVLYFLAGISLIVCNILLYKILNKKMEIDIYKIVTSLIEFIKTYQFVALAVIDFIGFIPFFMFNKIENSYLKAFTEQKTYEEEKKREKEFIVLVFKFAGYVILALLTIISSYFFITPLFLKI